MPVPLSESPYLRIKDWPPEDRPREKLLQHGPEILGNAELLAILIGTGRRGASAFDLGQMLIGQSGGLGGLARSTPGAIARIKGIGLASAARITAALELGRRLAQQSEGEVLKFQSPDAVYASLGPGMRDLRHEVFKVLLLDGGNRMLKALTVTQGILNASLVHPREVFKIAVDHQAAALILLHNHPSGESNPSREDDQVTQQMVEAGKIMGIPVLDHIIIARHRYYSYAQNHRMPETGSR